MHNPFSITKEQEAFLNSFTCERVSAQPENADLVWEFSSRQNHGLVRVLQENAIMEDSDRRPAAYYVIKDSDGNIVLYFSLRCGVLYDPGYVQEVMNNYDRGKDLMNALRQDDCSQEADAYLEALRTSTGDIPETERLRINEKYRDAREMRSRLMKDKNADTMPIVRVDKALPAVELMHFCRDERAKREWNKRKLGHSLGETMFWWFIVPKIAEINALTGCEYVYLFAADRSDKNSLINYYETALHFYISKKLVTIKPRYDFLCTLMCKRLYKLTSYRKEALGALLPREEQEDPLGLWDYRQQFLDYFNDVPGADVC